MRKHESRYAQISAQDWPACAGKCYVNRIQLFRCMAFLNKDLIGVEGYNDIITIILYYFEYFNLLLTISSSINIKIL
jgi:hypothetical protein